MKLLRANEAAEMLGLTNTHLYRLAKAGEIKIDYDKDPYLNRIKTLFER